jgi:ATP-dependent exoDNAse (exonuclease V) beta subunit
MATSYARGVVVLNSLSEAPKFNSKKHTYTVGRGKSKKQLTSVTQFVKQFFAPFDEKTSSEAKHYSLLRKGLPSKSPAFWRKEWKKTRELGTEIHDQIKKLILNEIDLTHDVQPLAVHALNAFHKYTAKNNPLMGLPEQIIFSEELGLAGTIDLLLLYDEDTVVLFDWKTNKEIKTEGYKGATGKGPCADLRDCNYVHYTLQLSTYAYILENDYGFKPKDLFLVHLTDNGPEVMKINYLKDKVREMIYDGNV